MTQKELEKQLEKLTTAHKGGYEPSPIGRVVFSPAKNEALLCVGFRRFPDNVLFCLNVGAISFASSNEVHISEVSALDYQVADFAFYSNGDIFSLDDFVKVAGRDYRIIKINHKYRRVSVESLSSGFIASLDFSSVFHSTDHLNEGVHNV